MIEIVNILLVLGIAMVPLSRLAVGNLNSIGQANAMTRAVLFAQERMEQIIADYAAKDDGRGYDWVIANWSGDADTPQTGFSRSVLISGEYTWNGVTYVVVQVSVGGTDISDVVLTTWLVDNS